MSEFPRTTFGLVSRLRDPRDDSFRSGLTTLCERYRDPVASYARVAWAGRGDDPDDLTQEFFLWLLETGTVSRFAEEKGSFRGFLKGLLRNFARNRAQAARRQKRGGGHATVALDDDLPVEDPRAAEAEAAFERAWVQAVTRRAIDRARHKLETGPRARQWKLFEACDLATEKPTYLELATRFGIKESDVRNGLFAARERVREEIRAELVDTVATPRDLEVEWRAVVGA